MSHISGGESGFRGGRFSVKHGKKRKLIDDPIFKKSSTYFPGAKRYKYTYKGQTDYFWARNLYDPIGLPVVILAIILIFSWILVGPEIKAGLFKVSGDYNTELVLEDNLGSVKDKNALYSSFNEFQEKTGITPALLTVRYQDYEKYYDSFEEFSYAAYASLFYDERHWLIIYEELGDVNDLPEDIKHYPSKDEPQWQVCSKQGEETDHILTYDVIDSFKSVFSQKINEGKSPDEAYVAAMNEILPNLRKFKISINLVIVIVTDLVLLFLLRHIIIITPKKIAMGKAVIVDEEEEFNEQNKRLEESGEEHVTCSYCHRSFPGKSYMVCPNCGTTFSIDPPEDEEPRVIEFHPSNK